MNYQEFCAQLSPTQREASFIWRVLNQAQCTRRLHSDSLEITGQPTFTVYGEAHPTLERALASIGDQSPLRGLEILPDTAELRLLYDSASVRLAGSFQLVNADPEHPASQRESYLRRRSNGREILTVTEASGPWRTQQITVEKGKPNATIYYYEPANR